MHFASPNDTGRSVEAQQRPKVRPLAVIGTVAGVLLFIYTLQIAGPREIARQLRLVGFGFVVVLALSAIRMAVRAKAWSLCIEETRTLYVRTGVHSVCHRRRRRQHHAARPTRERKHQGAAESPQYSNLCRILLCRARECFLQHQRRDHGHGRHAGLSLRLPPHQCCTDDHAGARLDRHRLPTCGLVALEQPAAVAQPLSHACGGPRRRR